MLRTTLVIACLVTALGSIALAAEKARPTIAILTFDYGGRNTTLEPLREGLAQMLIADVSSQSSVQVVERTRLKAVLEEQQLARSGKIDPATAARVGKLLGARFLVLGSYFDLAESMRVDARVVEVETGKIVRAVGANGSSSDFLAIEQDLAGKLGEILAAALPEAGKTKASARGKAPKVKSTTVATYGRALLALDDGKRNDAKTLLAKVVEEAPDFRLAKAELNALMQ